MTLFCYTGIPGAGKTYHAVMDMVHNRSAVITNVHVTGIDDCAVLPLNEITPEMLMSFSRWWFESHTYKENSLLLVIDEAQLLFNTRNWRSDKTRMGWIAFMSQHRKYGYRIILVTQEFGMIDKQFRSLVEFEVYHTAASSIWLPMRLLAMFGLHFTCANRRFPNDATKTVIQRDIYHVSRKYYRYYDSQEDLTARDYSDVDISALTSQLSKSSISHFAEKDTLSLFDRSKRFMLGSVVKDSETGECEGV